MREPMLVDHAMHLPNACCICTNTQGPFADTFFEDRAGRKYVCKRCAKTLARTFGLAAGKRMDELENVAVLLEQKDLELAEAVAAVEELRAGARSESAKVKELRAQLETVEGRLAAVAHVAALVGEGARELVGIAADPPSLEAVA